MFPDGSPKFFISYILCFPVLCIIMLTLFMSDFCLYQVLVLLGLVVMVAARPDSIVSLEDFHHEQDIAEDTSVTGSYRLV